MSYKSPLERLYGQPPRQDYRYSPYNRNFKEENLEYSNDHSSYQPSFTTPSPSPASSTGNRYSDRYRPTQYPRELTDQFEASSCKLCSIDFSSSIVGKMHYSGKPHAKKVKLFLTQWSIKTGLPIPEIGNTATPTGESLADYCEVCNARFLSLNDKLIHYSGKQHKKNEMDPKNAKIKKPSYDTYDLGRFGIGQGFCKEDPKVVEEEEFECKLCDKKAVNKEQLQLHLTGKKHKEKLAKKERGIANNNNKPERKFVCDICDVALETYKLYKLHIDGKRHQKTLMKKDIQGLADKCKLCNVNFSSIHAYNDHVQGKKHEKMLAKANLKKNTTNQDEQFSVACKYCTFVGSLKDHHCDKSLLKIDYQTVESKFLCSSCNQFFNSEDQYNIHKESRRHMLCVLNQESRDKVVDECTYCFVCNKQYSTNKEITNHLFEDRHMKLSASIMELNTKLYKCSVCDCVMDAGIMNSHMKDPKHLKNEIKKDTRDHLANETQVAPDYFCKHCYKTFGNFVLYSAHLLSEEYLNYMIEQKTKEYN